MGVETPSQFLNTIAEQPVRLPSHCQEQEQAGQEMWESLAEGQKAEMRVRREMRGETEGTSKWCSTVKLGESSLGTEAGCKEGGDGAGKGA